MENQKKASKQRPPRWKRVWRWTEFGEKKLWDWLHLLSALAIPVVLTVVGLSYTAQQEDRQQQIEEQRAQDLSLQAYLDQMSTLVLEDLDDPKVQAMMRARTLTVLERLDPSRKIEVIQFLAEANLVHSEGKRDPVIDLTEANLSGVSDQSGIELVGSHLGDADLSHADLSHATLHDADLSHATLRDADLSDAYLGQAHLHRADLRYADLSCTNLYEADLRYADLRDADLSHVYPFHADLVDDILLKYVNPCDVVLRPVKLGLRKPPEREDVFLEGATMPDGSKHP